jgi:hypothetical protein
MNFINILSQNFSVTEFIYNENYLNNKFSQFTNNNLILMEINNFMKMISTHSRYYLK